MEKTHLRGIATDSIPMGSHVFFNPENGHVCIAGVEQKEDKKPISIIITNILVWLICIATLVGFLASFLSLTKQWKSYVKDDITHDMSAL